MASKLIRFAPDRWTLLSALLIVAAFPPWNLAPLIWVALVPWFVALDRAPSLRAAVFQGVWLGFLMTLGGFYWVAHTLQEFGGLPWPLAVLGLLLFGFICQPQFMIFAPLIRWIRAQDRSGSARSGVALALVAALAYVGLDWLMPKLFADTLGHSLYQARKLRQAADLGGVWLLTFAIYFVNEALFRLVLRVKTSSSAPSLGRLAPLAMPLGTALALVGVLWGYGAWRYRMIQALESHPESRVQAAVIQANIGDFEKIAAEQGVSGAADRVLDKFLSLSDQALAMSPRPQVLIWPETSYPSTFRNAQTVDEQVRDSRVEQFARSRQVPLLFGGYDHFENKDYNAFFFLSPRGEKGVDPRNDLQIYRKNMLLLFGEYLPGAETFDFIKNSFPQVGNFGRGAGPSVLSVELDGAGAASSSPPVIRTSPIICYEALFPNYVIEGARQGSQFILNITNDSWFGPHGEPELHLSLTTFRSVETRLPQLRATNTGISTLILPDGEITQPTPIGEVAVLNTSIPVLKPVPTLLKLWGDWLGRTCFALALLSLLGLRARARSLALNRCREAEQVSKA